MAWTLFFIIRVGTGHGKLELWWTLKQKFPGAKKSLNFCIYQTSQNFKNYKKGLEVTTNTLQMKRTVWSASKIFHVKIVYSSSSGFDVMVVSTRTSKSILSPGVPHSWMSGTDPLQTPRAWF